MAGKAPRKKGDRFERTIVKFFEAIPGWTARRQPYSGAKIDFPHDIQISHEVLGDFLVECKSHKSPLRQIHNWLGQAQILVTKGDYEDPLITVPARVFAELIGPRDEN